MEKKFLKRFFLGLAAMLFLISVAVIVMDPFYHYHGTLGNMKPVLQERDYQVAGTLDHFDYQAVILGTSITENYNTNQFLENFGLTTVKAPRAGGSNADILWYLDRAYQHRDVQKVFYFLDYVSLESDLKPTFNMFDTKHMTNKNPLDDVDYLLNKDVLLKKIPLQFVYSYFLPYDDANAYSWYQTKTFSKEAVMSRYYPREEFSAAKTDEEMMELVRKNVELLVEKIKAHPETEFYIVFSPISILWWDDSYRLGEIGQKLEETKCVMEAVLPLENVKVFYYQNDPDMAANLDHYMDSVHFSYDVNRQICDNLAEGRGLVTVDNYQARLDELYRMVEEFSTGGVLEYYPEATVK